MRAAAASVQEQAPLRPHRAPNTIRVALVETSSRSFGAVAHMLHGDSDILVVSRETQLDGTLDPTHDVDVVVLVTEDFPTLERALLSRDVTTATPVVAVTAGARADRVASLLRVGVRAIVSPLHIGDQLLPAIEAAAAGLVAMAPEVLRGVVPASSDAIAQRQTTLSPREREILALVADGLGNKSIAARLGISEHTVKTHIASIFEKLGAETRAEAVAIGVRSGTILL